MGIFTTHVPAGGVRATYVFGSFWGKFFRTTVWELHRMTFTCFFDTKTASTVGPVELDCLAVWLRNVMSGGAASSASASAAAGDERRASAELAAAGAGQAAEAWRGLRNGGRRAQEATQSLPTPA